MAQAVGIIVQDVTVTNVQPEQISGYQGIVRYDYFPADFRSGGAYMRAWKAVIDETVVTDPNKYAEVITSMEDCRRYLELCGEQGIQTRTLFLCSDDGFSVRWKGDVPEGKRLGYEFCYSEYSDPEFLWHLDKDAKYEGFRAMLNGSGLFETEEAARAFGRQLYADQPWIDEEQPFWQTFVAEWREIRT